MKLEARDTVTHVPQACRLVADDRLADAFDVTKANDAGGPSEAVIASIETEMLHVIDGRPIERRITGFLENRRHRYAVGE